VEGLEIGQFWTECKNGEARFDMNIYFVFWLVYLLFLFGPLYSAELFNILVRS
jgi:hypothetical protein